MVWKSAIMQQVGDLQTAAITSDIFAITSTDRIRVMSRSIGKQSIDEFNAVFIQKSANRSLEMFP